MTGPVDHKSALAKAIEAQPRFERCFPINGFFKGPEKPILAVAIHVSRKAEDNAALVAAHKNVAEMARTAGDGAEGAKRDADLLGDAKLIEILYRVCRDVDPKSIAAAPGDPSQWKGTEWGAFPGPQWMRENLTTDQLAALYNLVVEVRAKAAPDDGGIDHEAVEAVARLCQEHADDDIPEAVLAQFTRTKLTHLVVLLSVELASERLSVETLLKQAEAAEQSTEASDDDSAILAP